MNYLLTKISVISNPDILWLIQEMEGVSGLQCRHSDFLQHFLEDCVNPNGIPKPIKKMDIAALNPAKVKFLGKKVKQLAKSEIYGLCINAAQRFDDTVELHEEKHLYMFINYFFIIKNLKPKTSKKIRRP